MKTNKGFVLVAALVVMTLMLALGGTAMMMSQMGYFTLSSENKYQKANWAAEYAVNEGTRLTTSSCPSAGTGSVGGATYSYFSIATDNNCFIHGKGQFATANVVKTVVMPFGRVSEWSSLVARGGGTLQLGGSASISNCDTNCKSPGVLYGGSLTQSVSGGLHDIPPNCPNNPAGVYGSPNAIQDSSGNACTSSSCSATVLSDRIPIAFNATDVNNLRANLSGTYNGVAIDVSTLSATSGLPAVPSTPSTPTPSCTCTNTAGVTLLKTTTSCTGVANFSACGGAIRFSNSTGTLTVRGIPTSLSTIVSAKAMSVTNVATADGDFSGKNLYTTGTANITINDVDVRFPNASTSSTVVAGGNVIVTNAGAINNAQMFSSGSGTITLTRSLAISASSFVGAGTTAVTIANNVTSINGSTIATRGSGGITVNKAISNSSLITNSASSNITINANVTNSKAVTNGSSANIVVTSGIVSGSALITNNADGNVTVQGGGSLSSTTVLSKDEFIFQSSSGITNSYIFANQNTIWKGSGDVSGGIIYSQADTYTQGTGGGNQQVGTSANPTLLIVGGDLFIQHTGTIDFNGLIFTNNTNYQGSGDFAINGSLISNGTTGSTVIQGSGNASINFRNDILTTLSANINSSLGRQLMRTPTCGTGGNKNTAMRNTKVTVF